MLISLGTDHAGYKYKEAVKAYLLDEGYEVRDFGAHSDDASDYPDYVRPAAEAVAAGECERAIVFGGSGNGEAICANKVAGIRCALCWNEATAEACRKHNDANALAIGERMISEEMAIRLVKIFLNTDFEGERHARRVAKIEPGPAQQP